MALRRVPALLFRSQLPPLAGALQHSCAGMASSSAPKTQTPPPDTARGATADLADVYITDAVDVVSQRKVQIMEPMFRWAANGARMPPR
jgi:hypothetical protein